MRKPKKPPLKVVKAEDPSVDIEENPPRDWTLPTAHWLKLDEARLAHWWAKLNGGDTVATLKAWADLLHIPRTKKA